MQITITTRLRGQLAVRTRRAEAIRVIYRKSRRTVILLSSVGVIISLIMSFPIATIAGISQIAMARYKRQYSDNIRQVSFHHEE